MLQLALAGEARYAVDEAELRLDAATYTVNTLRRLRSELGAEVPLVFLIGADHLLSLDRWKDWTKLFELAHFGVARRPGYALEPLPAAVAAEYGRRRAAAADLASSAAGRIVVFDMTPLDISSSAIRRALSERQVPRDALPAAVLAYIEQKSLYRQPPGAQP